MASTSSVVLKKSGTDMMISEITVTWDNSDLTAQDIVHQLPKGVTPIPLGHYLTTAGTDAADQFTYAFDNTNGEVDIVARAETGGSVANMVSVHLFMSLAVADQNGSSIDLTPDG